MFLGLGEEEHVNTTTKSSMRYVACAFCYRYWPWVTSSFQGTASGPARVAEKQSRNFTCVVEIRTEVTPLGGDLLSAGDDVELR